MPGVLATLGVRKKSKAKVQSVREGAKGVSEMLTVASFCQPLPLSICILHHLSYIGMHPIVPQSPRLERQYFWLTL